MSADNFPAVRDTGPADLIAAMARDPACEPAKLRELLAVRREWCADEARKSFNSAVVMFQQRAAIVKRGDTANGRAYARMDRIWRLVRPLLEQCGLAVTWESLRVSGESCTLDGHLRHADGHAQPLHHEIPIPQAIPGQNAAQRAGSAETYCKRYATCAALGIQTGDDDDGSCGDAGDVTPITEAMEVGLRDLIAETGSSLPKLLKWAGVEKLSDFPASKYAEAKRMMEAKRK